MASENGAGIVSNVGCDVNNTSQRTAESAGREAAGTSSYGTTWHAAVLERPPSGRACDHARNSPRTPTGFPAASSFHATTEEHGGLRRDSDPVSTSGDVGERVASEPDSKTRSPSPQRRSMSRQGNDLDGTARLPGEPDGNLV